MKKILALALILCGLFASQNVFASIIIVNSSGDTTETDGACTLREAIDNANNDTGGHTDCSAGDGNDIIGFAASVTTICLSASITISDVLTIAGDETNGTVIDGGDTTAGGTTTCSSSTTTGIFTTASGVVFESLTIKNGKFQDGIGGGILVQEDTLILNNTTVSGNTSSVHGGGIGNGGTLTLNNSTVSGNTSSSSGGGIFNDGTLTLNNSTVSRNTAGLLGGGIFKSGGTIKIKNTLLAENTGGSGFGGLSKDCYGPVDSYGYNLIETSSGCTLDYATSGADSSTDIIDQSALLDDLENNGGATQTQALQSTSPAVDTGSCTTINDTSVTTDQRDYDRDSHCDIGAYEYGAYLCGDASTTGPETCDDGNTTNNDACNSLCQIETLWYADADADTFGNASSTVYSIEQPTGYVTTATDCNDSDAVINTSATEVCGNDVDEDCSGAATACPTPETETEDSTTETASDEAETDDSATTDTSAPDDAATENSDPSSTDTSASSSGLTSSGSSSGGCSLISQPQRNSLGPVLLWSILLIGIIIWRQKIKKKAFH